MVKSDRFGHGKWSKVISLVIFWGKWGLENFVKFGKIFFFSEKFSIKIL
jgi:hypothetical protein